MSFRHLMNYKDQMCVFFYRIHILYELGPFIMNQQNVFKFIIQGNLLIHLCMHMHLTASSYDLMAFLIQRHTHYQIYLVLLLGRGWESQGLIQHPLIVSILCHNIILHTWNLLVIFLEHKKVGGVVHQRRLIVTISFLRSSPRLLFLLYFLQYPAQC